MKNQQMKMQLKKVFRNYRYMTPKLEDQLRQLGFSLVREKKHIILSYIRPDGRNVHIPISKTSSDKRAGLNLASKIVYATTAE